jgi:hypothetical protein
MHVSAEGRTRQSQLMISAGLVDGPAFLDPARDMFVCHNATHSAAKYSALGLHAEDVAI